MNEPNAEDQYCFWDTRSLLDTIIIMIIIIITFILFSRVFYRLIVYEIIQHYNKKRLIYLNLLIIIWAIVNMARKMFGVIIYFTVLRYDQDPNMTQYSIEYTKFSTVGGFLVNSIFLQVFYLYYNGLLNWIEISILTPCEHRLIKLFKIYYVIRIIIKIPLEILIFFLAQAPQFFMIDSLNNLLLVFDGLITSIFLVISYRMFAKYFEIIRFTSDQDKKKLKLQYMIIIIISFLRVIMTFLFLKEVKEWVFRYQQAKCFQEDIKNHLIYTIVYIILNNFLNHVFPILWVIKIYNLKQSSILIVQKNIDQINHKPGENDELLLSNQSGHISDE